MVSQVHNIGYRFDLLAQDLSKIGTVTPSKSGSVPNITNNINRAIKRSLDGMVFHPDDFANINPLTDRIKVWGSIDGVEKPLGIFMWTDAAGERHSYGLLGSSTMVDLNGKLDQPVGRPVGWASGASHTGIVTSLAQEVGIDTSAFPNTGTILSSSMNWASDVSRASIMAQVMNMAGWYSPFFNNAGQFTAQEPQPLAPPSLDYSGELGNIASDPAPVESNDLLSAPNRWICEAVGANDDPVWGSYDVPPSAPHSFANRGYYIVRTVQAAQGVDTSEECYQAALTAALSDNDTFEWVEFDGVPSHDHDTFDVVSYEGQYYREQEWRLPLSADLMHHSLRRTYQ
jgi:hypothetical protein